MKQYNPGFRMIPGSSVNHPSVLNLSLHTKYTTPQDSRLLSPLPEEAQDMTPNSHFSYQHVSLCLAVVGQTKKEDIRMSG